MKKPLDQTIVALDNMNAEEAISFLTENAKHFKTVKIGLELFCAYGPEIIHEITEEFDIGLFLDLKLHDIPNTVAKAIHSLKGFPIDFLTLHLCGGRKMIAQAIEAAQVSLPQTTLLGVSYLTSLGDPDFSELWDLKKDQVPLAFSRLFQLACDLKLGGVVCSPHELALVQKIEQKKNHQFCKVCPGIRFEDEINVGETGDQTRVLSPQMAIESGADYIVMGRSLTQAKNLSQRLRSAIFLIYF